MVLEALVQLLHKRVIRSTDDPDTVKRKKVMVILLPIVAGFMSVFGMFRSVLVYRCGAIASAGTQWFLFFFMIICRRLPLRLVETSVVLITLSTLLIDWSVAADVHGSRTWPYVLLITDVLLVLGTRRRVQTTCLHLTAAWTCVTAIEDAYRWGLYDIDGWSEQYPDQGSVDRVTCANPPCASNISYALGTLMAVVTCLYIDYAVTRGFAWGLRQEKRRVTHMVLVAEQVAECLVQFDLEAAQQRLDEAGADGLSAELGGSFRSLLANLAGYRPYLPQSCFEERCSTAVDATMGALAYDAGELELSARPERLGVLNSWDSGAGSACEMPGTLHRMQSGSSARLSSSRLSGGNGSDGDSPQLSGESTHSGASSCHSGLTVPLSRRDSATPRMAHAAQHKRVTLLALNRSRLLPALGRRVEGLVGWIAEEVAGFSAVVVAQKGVVDLLSADHLQASFGALRVQGAHRIAAVRCAAQAAEGARARGVDRSSVHANLAALPVTSAACTGHAICGDFGSDAARRFMVVGGVSAFSQVVERVAAGWGTEVLMDGGVHGDAQLHWDCRLLQMVLYAKVSEQPIGLWELCAEKVDRRSSQGEWMYELEAAPANPWAAYNAAVRLWCKKENHDALKLVSQALVSGCTSSSVCRPAQQGASQQANMQQGVKEALEALLVAIDAGPPPVCTVPVAAGIGPGAPLGAVQPAGTEGSTVLST